MVAEGVFRISVKPPAQPGRFQLKSLIIWKRHSVNDDEPVQLRDRQDYESYLRIRGETVINISSSAPITFTVYAGVGCQAAAFGDIHDTALLFV